MANRHASTLLLSILIFWGILLWGIFPKSARSQVKPTVVSTDPVNGAAGISPTPASNPNHSAADKRLNPAAGSSIVNSYGRLQLSFEANVGQAEETVKFLSRGDGYTLFLTSTEAVLRLKHGSFAAVRLKSIGSNLHSKVLGLQELPGKSNYFIGNDPQKWRTNIANYAKVQIEDAYPGIDLIYYGNQRQMEYDWIVAPGADPQTIRFAVESEAEPKFDSQGNLVLDNSGNLILRKPFVYQQRDGVRTEIAGHYRLAGKGLVSIQVGRYDPSLPLVIDPVLTYSTYLGGSYSGLSGVEPARAIAVDSSGNAYVTGWTRSRNFPARNPFQSDLDAYYDVFVTKFNPSGDALIYSTYLGGNYYDRAFGIAVDSSGNAYITGETRSADFPTLNPFQANLAHTSYYDAFITKLSASGNALVYSTYFGGHANEAGNGIAVDSSGNAYIAGETNSADFPTLNPFQANQASGYYDAFVAKFNPSGTALVYSTYLGSSAYDYGYGIALDSFGNAYVTGQAGGADFPVQNAVQAVRGQSYDAFVTKLNPSGNELIYSTYLGGDGFDAGYGIAVGPSGNAYVTGETASTDFPVKSPFQGGLGGGEADAFTAKLNESGNELIYSTYLGGSGSDYAKGIAIDPSGNAYVAGYTDSPTFPTQNPFQATGGGAYDDAFVAKLNLSGDRLIYSSYLGGSLEDQAWGIAVDSSGNAYVTGTARSRNFPTENPLQAFHGGGDEDAFVAKISPSAASYLDLGLNEGGAVAVSTSGGDGEIKVGYSDATVNSGASPYATAVISYKYDGIMLSEPGVPASPPTTSARIFIDFRTDTPAIPGRIDAGIVDINTGIAVINNGAQNAAVTYTLRDSNGATIAIGQGTVDAGKYFACFIDQLQNTAASDFTFPSDFGTATQFGSLQITSNYPLSVLALRGTSNQRNDFLITTTPIADLTNSAGTTPIYFPQFVDGGGYTTSIILMNTSATTETGTLQIMDTNGDPLVISAGGTSGSTFRYSIPRYGVYHFQTDGSPIDIKAGWVRVTPNAGTSTPIGSGVFGYNPADMLLSESGVPSAAATTHARVYVDLSGGHNTGLAIANVGDVPTDIMISAFEKDGVTAAGTSSDPPHLPAHGYKAAFADQFISGLRPAFTGVLDISATTPFAALTLRSMLNERHDFLMTTFPVADQTRAAPEPIVFPDIVDAGGYTTQFILISAGEAVSTTLFFYDNTGAPSNFIE